MRGASSKGFTLVELMVVVVIIGITSAVMLAEMRGTFEDSLLKATARKIIDACDAANTRAIATHEEQQLRIDSKEGRFVIVARRARAESEEAPPLGEVDLAGDAGELDTRIVLMIREPDDAEEGELGVAEEKERKARADVISFYPDGTCEAREFSLRDRGGIEMTLRINPVTSRVRIMERGPSEN